MTVQDARAEDIEAAAAESDGKMAREHTQHQDKSLESTATGSAKSADVQPGLVADALPTQQPEGLAETRSSSLADALAVVSDPQEEINGGPVQESASDPRQPAGRTNHQETATTQETMSSTGTPPVSSTMQISLPLRNKPAISSPPPPPPPPKDGPFPNLVAQKQPEYQEYDEKHPPEDDSIAESNGDKNGGDESQSEIQSIMDQFGEEGMGPGEEEIMSPRMEIASPVFFPPRASSLEADSQSSPTSPSLRRPASRDSYNFNSSRVRPPSLSDGLPPPPPPASEKPDNLPPQSPGGHSVFQPPPPSPDPEPDLPFDFHRFLEQLRHRTADPVARFLRSFLNEFGKKQWMVHEQVKIISDFLEFISKKMSQCDVWRTVSDAEFDNAREGMEKLVMNRLYSQTFSPAIPPVEVVQPRARRARAQTATTNGPGRRGQHQEDVERDDVIAQKIRIYGWIREEHLDIPSIGEKGRKFLSLAQQELLKINSYRAPRDKVIQILNCCKVIFGFLKNNKTDQSADSFVPLLIYTVLKANPAHLASNVQYILRFRNQDKLGGEAGYYISSLMGVISFVENLDRTNLTISNEEFEKNVEAAVSAIAEGHKAAEYEAATATSSSTTTNPNNTAGTSPSIPALSTFAEKSAPSRPEVTPRNSSEAERALSSPKRGLSKRLNSSGNRDASDGGGGSGNTSGAEDLASGLLRTIQKPLSGIGRMFSDDGGGGGGTAPRHEQGQSRSPERRGYGAQSEKSALGQGQGQPREDGEMLRFFAGSGRKGGGAEAQQGQQQRGGPGQGQGQGYPGVPAGPGVRDHEEAIRQLSAQEAEAQRVRSEEHRVVVETLQGMFPDLDKDVISDVVRMKEGRVGMAVDACLALSAG